MTQISLSTLNSIECTLAKLIINENNSIFLGAIYKPPNMKLLTNDLKTIFDGAENNPLLLGGDLNAKNTAWKNAHNNPDGIELLNWCNQNNITFKSGKTATRPSSSAYIDIILQQQNQLRLWPGI